MSEKHILIGCTIVSIISMSIVFLVSAGWLQEYRMFQFIVGIIFGMFAGAVSFIYYMAHNEKFFAFVLGFMEGWSGLTLCLIQQKNIMVNNFIEVYDYAMPLGVCKKLIDNFELYTQRGFGQFRQQYDKGALKANKDDQTIFTFEWFCNKQTMDEEITSAFYETLNNCLSAYRSKFDILHKFDILNNYGFRTQKTYIGGGYHDWHFELGDKYVSSRVLVYTIYLNDVAEGGETEFLYYPLRIKPKAGTVVLFPPTFTHTHRGNPPISNEKYIVTGWIEQ